MAKDETSSQHAIGNANLSSMSKVEKEDEAVTVINDTEATTTMDTKAVGAGSIQSWDQMYEALSAKFSGMTAIRLEVKSLAEQVHSLEEQRRKDQLVAANLIDDIKLMKRDNASAVLASGLSLVGSGNTVASSDDEIGQRTATPEESSSVDSTEKSFKARMLLSLCNVDKVAQFDGEPGTDATEWLRDFVDKSGLAGATDEFRLKAAPMNFQGIAKTWYVNHKEQLNNWTVFVDEFLGYFCPDDNRHELLGERLYTRRQHLNESALHFYDDVMRLCSKFNAAMSAKDRLDILLKGTRPEARGWMELRNPPTPAAFLKLLSEYERRIGQTIDEPDHIYPDHVPDQDRERQSVNRHPYRGPPHPSFHQQQAVHTSHQPHRNASQLESRSEATNSERPYPARNNSSRRWQGNEQ